MRRLWDSAQSLSLLYTLSRMMQNIHIPGMHHLSCGRIWLSGLQDCSIVTEKTGDTVLIVLTHRILGQHHSHLSQCGFSLLELNLAEVLVRFNFTSCSWKDILTHFQFLVIVTLRIVGVLFWTLYGHLIKCYKDKAVWGRSSRNCTEFGWSTFTADDT